MELKTNRDKFLDCLMAVKDAASTSNINPILSNVLIQVTKQSITMVATNHEIQMTASYPQESSKEFDSLLPVAKVQSILRVLDAGVEIKLKFSQNSVLISSGRSTFKLAIDKVDNFIVLGGTEEIEVLEVIEEKEIKRALRKVFYASAQQSHRMNLNGVYMERLADGMHFTATDGHRLATQFIDSNAKKKQKEVKYILPRRTVDILIQRLSDEGELEISTNDRVVKFKTEQFELVTNIIDENYPDYPSVIPRNNTNQAVIERKTIQSVIRRVAVLAEKGAMVNFSFSENRLNIECLNRDNDSLIDWLDIKYSKEDIQIGFNIDFIFEVLNALETEMIEVNMADGNSSVLVKGIGDDSFNYVLMPIHT